MTRRGELLEGEHTEVARTCRAAAARHNFQSTLELLRDIKVINKDCTGPAGFLFYYILCLFYIERCCEYIFSPTLVERDVGVQYANGNDMLNAGESQGAKSDILI